jgi:hypothetical protein
MAKTAEDVRVCTDRMEKGKNAAHRKGETAGQAHFPGSGVARPWFSTLEVPGGPIVRPASKSVPAGPTRGALRGKVGLGVRCLRRRARRGRVTVPPTRCMDGCRRKGSTISLSTATQQAELLSEMPHGHLHIHALVIGSRFEPLLSGSFAWNLGGTGKNLVWCDT